MKIRSDFITNSSSSAFVIIGTKISDDADREYLWEITDENDLRFFSEEGFIGRVIANLDFESYGAAVSLDLKEIHTLFEEVQNTFNKLGIKGEVKLIADVFMT